MLEHEEQHIKDHASFERELCRVFRPGVEGKVPARTGYGSEINA